MIEDTLIILKPDSISRGLVGNIIDRLEKVGLKLVACKMCMADDSVLNAMYNKKNRQWVEAVGEKTLQTLKTFQAESLINTKDTYKIGLDVTEKLKDYMKEGPIIVMVWEGIQAVSVARKIRGSTTPLTAELGTINGDYSYDSQISTILNKRSLRNIAHASGTVEEANSEITLWFGENFKPMDYDRTDQIYF